VVLLAPNHMRTDVRVMSVPLTEHWQATAQGLQARDVAQQLNAASSNAWYAVGGVQEPGW